MILCRWPEPGRCKTRLEPAVGPEGAAHVHRALAQQTVQTVRQSGLPFELHGTGAEEAAFQDWLGQHKFRPQVDGDLGAKLMAAGEPYPVLFLGTDAPNMTADHLGLADQELATHDMMIGPAKDGGYWTIGLSRPCPVLFEDMPWGTERVFELTMARAEEQGLNVHILPELADLDRPEDLERWPQYAP
ncbi:MAG: TIGR04282 family arsenosugar biosynthesis glycosyltransferase [Pseudomonadota bacterium]